MFTNVKELWISELNSLITNKITLLNSKKILFFHLSLISKTLKNTKMKSKYHKFMKDEASG